MSDETIVTGAQMRVAVTCGDRRYLLRPITFREAAEIATEAAGVFDGGAAMMTETVRRAVERLDPARAPERIADLDAHEEAEMAHAAVAIARPHPQEPPEAWPAWRAEMRQANLELMRAALRRTKVEKLVADDPEVAKARGAMERAAWARRRKLLVLALLREDGTTYTPDEIDALPAADATDLFLRADAMARPGPTEGKA